MNVPTEADTVDELLQVLADTERRSILTHLAENGGESTIDELVAVVFEELPAEKRQKTDEQIETALYHVHLPKLASHELVAYDTGNGAVGYQSDEFVETLLATIHDRE